MIGQTVTLTYWAIDMSGLSHPYSAFSALDSTTKRMIEEYERATQLDRSIVQAIQNTSLTKMMEEALGQRSAIEAIRKSTQNTCQRYLADLEDYLGIHSSIKQYLEPNAMSATQEIINRHMEEEKALVERLRLGNHDLSKFHRQAYRTAELLSDTITEDPITEDNRQLARLVTEADLEEAIILVEELGDDTNITPQRKWSIKQKITASRPLTFAVCLLLIYLAKNLAGSLVENSVEINFSLINEVHVHPQATAPGEESEMNLPSSTLSSETTAPKQSDGYPLEKPPEGSAE